MFGYVLRLVWMSLAAFFLVNFTAGLAIRWMAPAAMRTARKMRARSASRFLFAVRVFPCVCAILIVAGFCIPSYLWLEPRGIAEEISIPGLAAAMLGFAILGVAMVRSLRAIVRSRRWAQECRAAGREIPVSEGSAWVIDNAGSAVGLGGVFRPQIVIRSEVLNALSTEQLEVAVRHEWAHRDSRDNLKRLMILATPDLYPGWRGGFAPLEKAWATFTEWAADDEAVAGDSRLSLVLAAALVQVARMGIAGESAPLVTSLVSDAPELSTRIERLLDPTPESGGWRRCKLVVTGAGMLLFGGATLFRVEVLHAAHRLLENLAR